MTKPPTPSEAVAMLRTAIRSLVGVELPFYLHRELRDALERTATLSPEPCARCAEKEPTP